MHFSWVSGGNEQWFSHWATPITDLASATFFISFFQGGYIGHQPLWQVWNKKDWGMRVLLFNHFQGDMKRRLGVSPFQLQESPVILHLLHCHSLLEQHLFFSKRKKCMILSLIWLYLFQPVIENIAIRGLQAVGLNADQAEHTEYTSAYSSYLAAFFPVCTVEMNI